MFIVKCLFYYHPFSACAVMYTYSNLLFAVALRILERSVYRDDPTSYWHTYGLSLWITTVTLPGIGFGDYYPQHLGRISMVLCVFWGYVVYSLYINIFLDLLLFNRGQTYSKALLDRIRGFGILREKTGRILGFLIELHKIRKYASPDLDKIKHVVHLISNSLAGFKIFKRYYRSINGEYVYDLLRRSFRYATDEASDYQKLLNKMEIQQKLIAQCCEFQVINEEPQASQLYQNSNLSNLKISQEHSNIKTNYFKKEENKQMMRMVSGPTIGDVAEEQKMYPSQSKEFCF